MKLAVTDANIFIDLHYVQLTVHLFSIGLSIYTTQEVFDELNDDQQATLRQWDKSGLFVLYKFEATEHEELESFTISKKLSFNDHTVIYLAEKLQSIVLTGDNKLKQTCLKRNIDAHGLFWILDTFLEKELITKETAKEKLIKLMNFNKWLPIAECNKRLTDWS